MQVEEIKHSNGHVYCKWIEQRRVTIMRKSEEIEQWQSKDWSYVDSIIDKNDEYYVFITFSKILPTGHLPHAVDRGNHKNYNTCSIS